MQSSIHNSGISRSSSCSAALLRGNPYSSHARLGRSQRKAAIRASSFVATLGAKTNKASMGRSGADTIDTDMVRQDWTERGFSFGVFVDPPGRIWPDFVHQTDEVVMLTKGELELTFNGQSVRPEIGEEVLIPAKALHTVENTGSTTNKWLYGYKNK